MTKHLDVVKNFLILKVVVSQTASKARENDEIVEAFDSAAVTKLTGVPPSTLDYWVRPAELVTPSVHASTGRRASRYWSLQDVVLIRTLRALREAGCPMQTLRKAKDVIENAWGERMENLVLYWTGDDLLAVAQWGDVKSVLKRPGQGVLHFVAVPIPQWRRELAVSTMNVNVSRLQRMADERRTRPGTPTEDLAAPGSVARRSGRGPMRLQAERPPDP